MPKKPIRDNPRNRTTRTVQSAASVLQRLATRGNAVSIPFENQVLEKLRTRLPLDLRPHVVDVVEKVGELIIFAESAVWAARLKLAIADNPALVPATARAIVKLAPRGASGR